MTILTAAVLTEHRSFDTVLRVLIRPEEQYGVNDSPGWDARRVDPAAPVAEQWHQLGPDSLRGTCDRSAAEDYCATLSRAHSENFAVVSWLLPRSLHQHFHNVYAYCRWSDDLADELPGTTRSLEALQWWRSQLDGCYARVGGATTEATTEAGAAVHPVFVALEGTIRDCGIPRTPFEDLISAFEQDQRVTEYTTFTQLRDYCRRSADPVGRLVLFVVGAASERNFAWSDSICTGLQLANFWQDVARDADIGRTYLPREDRERFGYSDRDLAERRTNDAFLALMRFEVERARDFLQRGLPLVDVLPGRLRVDIDLFARGGLRILDRIEGIDYRVWDRRVRVGKWDAGRLLVGSCLRATWRGLVGRRRPDEPPNRPRTTPSESGNVQ